MNARLDRLKDRLRTSLWAVPGGMAAAAIALAVGSIALDKYLDDRSSDFLGWAYSGGPEGARALLATVAGSMATVAGVTFSITIVALTMASSQFGPRLLRNFMRDTSNQFVLGTFTAAFVYCLMVLRTIRGSEDNVFVPQVSVTLGVLVALAGLGVLIYFIHHVSASLQADSVIAAVGAECHAVIDKLYPEDTGSDSEVSEVAGPSMEQLKVEGAAVPAQHSGYVQALSREDLIDLAARHDLVIRLHYRPGDFVIAGSELLTISPAQNATEQIRARARGCVVLGAFRTPIQDVEFSIGQLVEIAARALSPGVNDPFTAIACIDRLGSIIARLAQCEFRSPYWRDPVGRVRIVSDEGTFEGAVDTAFNQIRQYGATDVAVLIRMLETIAALLAMTRRLEDRIVLLRHSEMIHAQALRSIPEPRDREDIEKRYRTVISRFGKDAGSV